MGIINGVTDFLGLSNTGASNQALGDYMTDTAQNTNALKNLPGNDQYYGAANNDYGQQQGAVGLLGDAATGRTPSAADLQMQQGQQAANAQIQSAMLSQQGGMSPGLANRNMLNAQGATQASLVGQGTVMRANEQATARQQYANAIQAMRGQSQNQAQGAQSFDLGRLGQIQGNNQNTFGNAQNVATGNSVQTQGSVSTLGNLGKSVSSAVAPGSR